MPYPWLKEVHWVYKPAVPSSPNFFSFPPTTIAMRCGCGVFREILVRSRFSLDFGDVDGDDFGDDFEDYFRGTLSRPGCFIPTGFSLGWF